MEFSYDDIKQQYAHACGLKGLQLILLRALIDRLHMEGFNIRIKHWN